MSEWGPEIVHDGARPDGLSDGMRIRIYYSFESGRLTNGEGAEISPDFPGFFWRWKTVRLGLFGRRKIRVCDDPAFRPIVSYRLRKPRGLVMLEGILTEVEAIGPVVPMEAMAKDDKLSGRTSPGVRACLGRAESPANCQPGNFPPFPQGARMAFPITGGAHV